ncbi:MAG: hypothetical protein ACI4XA_07010 [Oscillospiraceae bacterium]
MAKKMTAADFFGKHNRSFIKFGEMFAQKLVDPELISALAEKDLEKLAKVFKLVFEMLEENSGDNGTAELVQLIGEYSDMDGGDDP